MSEQWAQSCKTAGNNAGAAFYGGPSCYLDGGPEEVFDLCEAVYVAETKE
jgi:hypothetical protein